MRKWLSGLSLLMANAGLEKSKQIGTFGAWQYQTRFTLRYAAAADLGE